jgi:glutathione S-transferase
MALKYSGLKIELREVTLKNYPQQARLISPKATVPVLQLADGTVLDESWDIVKWALEQNDPDCWMGQGNEYLLDAEILVETNDFSFKEGLDHYKYADRFPEHDAKYYREACETFLEELEEMLRDKTFLLGEQISLADVSVFPFIRQFSLVDKSWFFEQAAYPKIQNWLNVLTGSTLFQSVFHKHEVWQQGDSAVFI